MSTIDKVVSISLPFAIVTSVYAIANVLHTGKNDVEADSQIKAKNGATKMNSSLDKLSGNPVPSELVASRLRPDDISHSVSEIDGLMGKHLLNQSHSNIATNAKLNKTAVSRVGLAEVHQKVSGGSKVLPSVVDPSMSFLQSELQVFHPNPSYDIRGDPPIKTGGPCPMEAPMPGQGPWQPELDPIRAGTHYPIPVENMASKEFFS